MALSACTVPGSLATMHIHRPFLPSRPSSATAGRWRIFRRCDGCVATRNSEGVLPTGQRHEGEPQVGHLPQVISSPTRPS